ncbi:hypothetical protein RDT67_23385 [Serratia fonticola]|uniref:Uncharacterized protein n=1 Tax=Serratia fonticola TaxID=47917 RepID=A0AAJ1YEZ8_SERFO|nr:hypothetical protein [Serratia fonticola]MDQ9129366.1 hypothetical protein [Serratia fonticola]
MKINFSEVLNQGNEYRPFASQYLHYSCISVDDFDAKSKFSPVFLKEVGYGIKVGGEIKFNLTKYTQKNIRSLIKLLDIYLPNFSLVNTNQIFNSEEINCVVVKKQTAELECGDDIDSWTFGIISNGKRPEFIFKLIDSIIKQKIIHSEVILCGHLDKESEEEIKKRKIKFTYYEMSEFDSLGWITRKKNIVMENAIYPNVMVLHDRFILHDSWHESMKRYGNTFEVLACRNENGEGKRITDWVYIRNVFSKTKNHSVNYELLRPYLLDRRDWSRSSMISGGVTIIKKNCWSTVKWDERRFWIEQEDTLLSNLQQLKGIVPRYYSGAVVISLIKKGESIRPLQYSPGSNGIGVINFIRDSLSVFIKRNKTLRKIIYKDI